MCHYDKSLENSVVKILNVARHSAQVAESWPVRLMEKEWTVKGY